MTYDLCLSTWNVFCVLECVLNVSGVPDRIPVTLHRFRRTPDRIPLHRSRSRSRSRTRPPHRLLVTVNGYRFAVNVYGLPANDAAERHAPTRSALRLAGACPHPNRYRDRDRDRLCFRRTPDRIPLHRSRSRSRSRTRPPDRLPVGRTEYLSLCIADSASPPCGPVPAGNGVWF